MRAILLGLAALTLTLPARAEFVFGHVSARHGDVFTVIIDDDSTKPVERTPVRFADILLPRPPHPLAAAVEAELDDQIVHRAIMVVLHGKGADCIALGTFYFDRENFNEWLVLSGLAWPTENTDDKNMPGLVQSAQAAKNGIWQMPKANQARP